MVRNNGRWAYGSICDADVLPQLLRRVDVVDVLISLVVINMRRIDVRCSPLYSKRDLSKATSSRPFAHASLCDNFSLSIHLRPARIIGIVPIDSPQRLTYIHTISRPLTRNDAS